MANLSRCALAMHPLMNASVSAVWQEDELRTLEDASNKATAKAAVDAEYVRNRTRVIEIWNLHAQNKAELKLGSWEE